MGPKIESAMSFLQAGGSEVIITSYEHLCEAVEGAAGTHIVPDGATHIAREEEMMEAMEESFRT
jgi:hypothetical protein